MSTDQGTVYYPEDLSLLGEVLDQIVQSLPPKMRTRANLAEIAKNILACAATGQRDPLELELAACIGHCWSVTDVKGDPIFVAVPGWPLPSITVNNS